MTRILTMAIALSALAPDPCCFTLKEMASKNIFLFSSNDWVYRCKGEYSGSSLFSLYKYQPEFWLSTLRPDQEPVTIDQIRDYITSRSLDCRVTSVAISPSNLRYYRPVSTAFNLLYHVTGSTSATVQSELASVKTMLAVLIDNCEQLDFPSDARYERKSEKIRVLDRIAIDMESTARIAFSKLQEPTKVPAGPNVIPVADLVLSKYMTGE